MTIQAGRFLLTGLAALSLSTSARAIDALLTDDTCTGASRAPQGDVQVLQVSDTARTYLKFRFDTVLPEGTRGVEIARATLRVWIRKGGSFSPQRVYHNHRGRAVPGLAIYPLLSDWSETTLDLSNAPAHGVAAFRDFIDGREKAFFDIDLTNLVREWIAGQRPNFGIVLAGVAIQDRELPTDDAPVPARLSIDSKENQSSSHEPRLQIVLRSVLPDQEGEIINPSVTNPPPFPAGN